MVHPGTGQVIVTLVSGLDRVQDKIQATDLHEEMEQFIKSKVLSVFESSKTLKSPMTANKPFQKVLKFTQNFFKFIIVSCQPINTREINTHTLQPF